MPTWSAPISLRGPAGPAGTNATLPKNIVGNSLNIAPVAGETQAVQIGLQTTNGTQNFLVDATGNLTTAGLATIKGAAAITGTLTAGDTMTAARSRATSAGTLASPAYGFAGEFRGAGTTYVSGLYFNTTFGDVSESVGGYQSRGASYLNGSPRDQGAGYLTHVFRTSIANGGVDAYRFQVSDSNVALRIAGNGATTLAGLFTAAGVTLSSGAITFADGTTLATAPAATAAPTTFAATQPGTAASPAFRFSGATNGAGLYFDGALGNALISVNGYASLTSTAASGAAAGASGWAVRTTLGSGATALAVFGSASTTAPVWSVDGAGSVAAGALTLSGAVTAASARVNGAATITGLTTSAGVKLSTGSLTFADGTSLSTAPAAGGGGSAGPSASFSATSPGTAASPAFNYQGANNGAGVYFDGAAGNVLISANGAKTLFTQAASGAASGASSVGVASTLGAGAQVLGLFGQGVDSSVAGNAQFAVDGAGNVTAGALTLKSANGVTYADGSVQTSALAVQAQPALTQAATTYYATSYTNGQALTATPQPMNVSPLAAGQPMYFVAPPNCALVGLSVTVFSTATSSNVFTLYDVTAAKTIYTSGTVAQGTITNGGPFTATQYTLVAGNTYVWQVQGSGTSYSYLVPQYLTPSSIGQGVSAFMPFVVTNATFSGTAVTLQTGNTGGTAYYQNPLASYLYAMQVSVTGTASVTVTFNGVSSGVVTAATSPVYVGPFKSTRAQFAARTSYTATAVGSGTGNLCMVPMIVM